MMCRSAILVVLFVVCEITALNIAVTDPVLHTINLEPEGDIELIYDDNSIYKQHNFHRPYPISDEDWSGESTEDYPEEMSFVWYTAVGAITLFPLLVCTVWCCKKCARDQALQASNAASAIVTPAPETPPPAYDLFAPPAYDSLKMPKDGCAKTEPMIIVISSHDTLDSWSIVWYIASFGGLIAFFLVVSCSEWCCRKRAREQQSQRRPNSVPASPTPSSDAPPPSYDLFAPPSYESLNTARSSSEKSEYDVYVVPVHAFGNVINSNNDRPPGDPPSYATINDSSQQLRAATNV